ncbi:hypothetical protein LguiB_004359 [Lonicera macranthoides]
MEECGMRGKMRGAVLSFDGSVHNLNEYIEISTKDVAKSVGPDLVDEVFTQKLGVLISQDRRNVTRSKRKA